MTKFGRKYNVEPSVNITKTLILKKERKRWKNMNFNPYKCMVEMLLKKKIIHNFDGKSEHYKWTKWLDMLLRNISIHVYVGLQIYGENAFK